MPARRLVLSAAVVAAASPFGCAVIDPPGWARRRTLPVTEIRAKPWVMYGVAPRSWVSPLGEVGIAYDQKLTRVGPYTSGASFTVRFRGTDEAGLSCRIYVGPSGVFAPYRETHGALFGCVSASREVVFFAGRGCRYPHDVYRTSCHQGQLRIGERRVAVERGILEQLRSPVGYVSYTAPGGELLGAANIVGQLAMTVWLRPARSSAGRRRQRSLVLLTVALHQFHHFMSG